MAVTDWIDALSDLMGTIDDGRGGKVKSYRVYAPLTKNTEFPESISAFPCALSYVVKIRRLEYSASAAVVIWSGVSEFHIMSNTAKSGYPELMRYYDRIIKACASDIQLSGLVSYFTINQDDGLVAGELTYGSNAPHLGIIVNWEVKENPTISVS
jgi:hypothetical protein